MNAVRYSSILIHDAPGERRGVLLDANGHPCRLFLERWGGVGEPARYGSVHEARLRAFADPVGGAFLELESGEEAFLRLNDPNGLTQGARMTVEIVSEAREGKRARVVQSAREPNSMDAWTSWLSDFDLSEPPQEQVDDEAVTAAFDEALSSSVTISGGGRLHIDRTRALTAFDTDTSGRVQKGSAGARALTVNKDAVGEMARQVSLRGLGGNLVLDCVAPLNKAANEQLKATAETAFKAYDVPGIKVLRPSPLGLMEASAPWRYAPIEDRLKVNPGETELLGVFRAVQREAAANPSALFELTLSKPARTAYLDRQREAKAELARHFGGRITIADTEVGTSGMRKR
jgi:Ribonuclease G/E